MVSRREERQESARFRVMRLLANNSKISTRGLADAVGISNGAAYYVLKSLVEKGFVKVGNFSNNPKKTQYVYLLTPKGIVEKGVLTRSFIKRKRLEFEALRVEINTLEDEIKSK